MRQKRIIYYVTEILYLLVMFGYLLVVKNSFSTAIEYDFLCFLCYAGVILSILLLVGPKWNRYIGLVFGFFYTLYLVAQTIYHRGFGQYFRFSTALGLSKEVTDVGDSIMELIHFSDIVPFLCLIVITVVFVILYFTLQKGISIPSYYRFASVPLFMIAIVCFFMMQSKIMATREGTTDFDVYKSDFYIYDAIPNTNQFKEEIGLLPFLYRDVETLLFQKGHEGELDNIDAYFAERKRVKNTNDLTGIFKGKSVLVIQAESLMNVGISEEFTPNLYYYQNAGLHVKDFNTPLLVGSTSDTEFMANTSIIPMTNGYPVCYAYINNTYPNTLGHLFEKEGYDTFAYHNNYAEYYNRNITFDTYGYDFFDSARLGLENLEPDTKLAESIGWILSEKDKFLGYWVTYSRHQPYDLSSTGVNPEDVQKIKEKYPDLEDAYVSYIAKAMDVDKAVGNFLNVMDWSGRLDDVVIVLYGDHVAKGLDFSKGSNFDQVFGVNSDDHPEILYTPLLIYANGIEHKEVTKPSTALDILPTMMNLWGIDYDVNEVFGSDIFDETYRGFYFDEAGNYKTKDFHYNLIRDELMINGDISKNAAKEAIVSFNRIKEICAAILKLDYFSK